MQRPAGWTRSAPHSTSPHETLPPPRRPVRTREYARHIPEFRVIDSDDGEARVEFSGTRGDRGTNVDMLTEMIAVMNAARAYDSDASIFDVGKRLAEKTIDLERL